MIRANTDIPIKLMKTNQVITSPDVKGNLMIKLIKNKIVWSNKKRRSLQIRVKKNNFFSLSIKIYNSKSTNRTNISNISR